MSLFQCHICGCRENTACANQGFIRDRLFDWSGIEEYRGKKLCCVCGPKYYSDGKTRVKLDLGLDSGYVGVWHGRFDRIFLPKGEFTTDRVGNLVHISNPNKTVATEGRSSEYEPQYRG